MLQLSPFECRISDAAIADLHQRLENARMAPTLTDDSATADFGISQAQLLQICSYWKKGFDWRAFENRINKLPMFTAPVNGHTIHFVYAKSPRPDAKPLMLTHGWPGSFMEFQSMVEPLSNPETPATPAFHVICPSIPGFGFSPNPTSVKKLTVQFVAGLFVDLMRGLGYNQFFAQGGDWGSMITRGMAIYHPKNCVAIHLNLAMADLPTAWSYLPQRILFKANPSFILSDQEMKGLQASHMFWTYGTGYYKQQGTKPYTLGVGLNDSPMGLLAWIGEKFNWAEAGVDPDILLGFVSLFWFTQSITSSFRLYKDNYDAFKYATKEYVATPTGVAIFKDISQPPEAWLKYVYNLKHYRRMPRGGHFAALEEPILLLDDLRLFFGKQELHKLCKL
ncbi:epoxide hydrolase domain-containing protein [Chytriomyces sp. MP71]|nr:epoxide hydrolase domain-containing protein [Chytriomyces sp. MP71]